MFTWFIKSGGKAESIIINVRKKEGYIMLDYYGRDINYMRISITDRCNFRCRFCVPQEKIEYLKSEDILTFEEMIKVVQAVMPLGIHQFRITGGEPLLREGVVAFIHTLKALDSHNKVFLTTNGYYLKEKILELKQAGLDGVNVSLSSMDSMEYEKITGVNAKEVVFKAILAAVKMELPVKVNCVTIPEWNESQLLKIAELAKEHPIDVRFIEMMPIGQGANFQVLTGARVLDMLETNFGVAKTICENKGSGPANYVKFQGFSGTIGFINATSCGFCNECNRIRLTADGYLKLCLNSDTGFSIRDDLRSLIETEQLSEKIRCAVFEKPQQHDFLNKGDHNPCTNTRLMSQIGG